MKIWVVKDSEYWKLCYWYQRGDEPPMYRDLKVKYVAESIYSTQELDSDSDFRRATDVEAAKLLMGIPL